MVFFLQKTQARILAQLICAGRFVLGADKNTFSAQADSFALSLLEKIFDVQNFDKMYEGIVHEISPALYLFETEKTSFLDEQAEKLY